MTKKTAILFLLGLFALFVKAQQPFKTIVPKTAVVVGESFSVQYVAAGANTTGNFIAPVFHGFRIVAGPYIYLGPVTQDGFKQSKNFVFTLVALNPGKQIIPGAFISINGKKVRSNDNLIEVISEETAVRKLNKEIAGNSDYFLRPGEDVNEKIRQNLFLQVVVDKRNCFVGEPVLATFKLYSRLESKSDIVKNPAFYGFSVQDIVNLSDRLVTTENVNKKAFDVHTIRKVQLYPLRPGVFTIDAMEIKNKVEFSRTVVNRKTEQEISEGVLNNDETEIPKTNTETFENDISTTPVAIIVRPVPERNKPEVFDGAVGSFTISVTNVKDRLAANEEGLLEIIISGKGNFIQLNAPAIIWPEGIEGFEPVIKDSWSKETMPITGSRVFRYPFVSSSQGAFSIPPVIFSFFNPDSGRYKTIATPPLIISINKKEKNTTPVLNQNKAGNSKGTKEYWLIAGLAFLVVSGGLFLFFRNNKTPEDQSVQVQDGKAAFSFDEIFTAVNLQSGDKIFYASLYQSIWRFFGLYYNLSGSEMNKENLLAKMQNDKIERNIIEEVQNILQQCEAGMFTNANLSGDKSLLLDAAIKTMGKIHKPSL